MPYQPDETDLKILCELEQNGRISNKELAAKINLSPAPTLERVRKLEANQYISGYHAELNYSKLGQHIEAVILINFQKDCPEETIRELKNIQEIKTITRTEGQAGLLLEIITESLFTFSNLKDKLTALPGISKADTLFKLRKIK